MSIRDDEQTLIEAIARVALDEAYQWGDRPHDWDGSAEDVRDTFRDTARNQLAAATPAALLSWLAAQREDCPTCGGDGGDTDEDGTPYPWARCPTCHGEGSVPVDVVGVCVKLGLLEYNVKPKNSLRVIGFRRPSQEAPNE